MLARDSVSRRDGDALVMKKKPLQIVQILVQLSLSPIIMKAFSSLSSNTRTDEVRAERFSYLHPTPRLGSNLLYTPRHSARVYAIVN